jgi:glycosyltransferase involved in cell wall biosynthesis
MRVALVHDWLTGLRGGEKVLEVLCELFPNATLFTLVHVEGATSATIESLPIRTAFTQKLPGVKRLYRWYLPIHPWAIESLDLSEFDVVLSSSHCVAKGAISRPGAVHISYCHTPMRYVWDRFEDYFGNGLAAKLVYGPVARRLREWDRESARRVDHFIANSTYVAGRIEKYYGRQADAVIPPPVDTERYTPSADDPDDYFLVVSALVPYKRIDLAIDAFRRRKDSLIIVGSGPSARRLQRAAPPNVEFRGWVSDDELKTLYRHCRACLLPGVEDFGIVPLEAQASGAPVVAYGHGGALDTVRDGETGIFFAEQTPEALSRAIDKVCSLRLNKKLLRDWALGFSRESFRRRMQDFIRSHVAEADF